MKRSKFSLAAIILATLASFVYFNIVVLGMHRITDPEGGPMIFNNPVLIGLSTAFLILGYALNIYSYIKINRKLTTYSGILYALSFFSNVWFGTMVFPSAILQFIGQYMMAHDFKVDHLPEEKKIY